MKPMRAHDLNLDELPEIPALVQPKLHGIRATWDHEAGKLRTRNGRAITSVPHIVEAIRKMDLAEFQPDMELYSPWMHFDEINGSVRRKKPNNKSMQLEAHIFDFAVYDVPMDVRAEMIKDVPENGPLKRVDCHVVRSQSEITALYDQFISSGLEGLILRTIDGLYCDELDHSDLFRLKPAYDIEAKLIDFFPSVQGDAVASLRLRLANGKTFNCDVVGHQRKTLWRERPIGASVTVQYNSLTNNGVPFGARFSHIRHDL